MGVGMKRLYGKYVATSLYSAIQHIRKHNLDKYGISLDDYLKIGDLSGGEEGRFQIIRDGKKFTVVVRGAVCDPDPEDERKTKVYGLLRSIWCSGAAI